YLLKNGKPLGETVLSKGSPWTKSFKNISLEAGDRIDAAAGVGASGSFHNDETQFSLTIKPAQTDRGSAAGDVAAEVLKQIQAPLKEMVEEAVEKALKKSSQPAPSASATPAASQSPAPAENPLPPGTADTSGGFRN
ncbi:MAG TPA: hypothetical protein VHY22_16730, partial [Chthoniobacteraceae bacterium]|nr:hypothetical protein [Chthoniobacteraceae bacterium]